MKLFDRYSHGMRLTPSGAGWLLSHEETNRNARIQAVADFLIQRFRQDRRKWFS